MSMVEVGGEERRMEGRGERNGWTRQDIDECYSEVTLVEDQRRNAARRPRDR